LLRVSAPLPAPKRRILDYSRELAEFATQAHVTRFVLVRSVASVFCIEQQLQNWPQIVRRIGDFPDGLDLPELEAYSESQEMIRWAVRGDLVECLGRFCRPVPFSVAFRFVDDASKLDAAKEFAELLCGSKLEKVPSHWEPLNVPQ
jgi:hypothetical protein